MPTDDGDDSTTEDLGVYEMLWDCPYCGQKKNLGKTHRHCPACGAAQDPNLRYFPPPEEAVAVKDHEFVGADKICAHCQAPMSAKAEHCGNCGAALDGTKQANVRRSQSVAEGQAFSAESISDAKRERDEARRPVQSAPESRSGGALKWVILGVAALSLVLYFVLRKHDAAVVITGHTWTREVQVERFGPHIESAWCDQLPFGAYGVSRHREERSTKSVPDGQECNSKRVDNGDGTFKTQRECHPKYRREPVYDDKCNFTVDRWTRDRTATARGASLAETPRWPELSLRTGTCVGCEREGGRSETYELQFTDEKSNKADSCKVGATKWQATPDRGRYVIRVGMTGADCDSMQPAH